MCHPLAICGTVVWMYKNLFLRDISINTIQIVVEISKDVGTTLKLLNIYLFYII